MRNEEVQIIFEEETERVCVKEFTNLFYKYRTLYSVLWKKYKYFNEDFDLTYENFLLELEKRSWQPLYNIAPEDMGEDELYFDRISKRSPLVLDATVPFLFVVLLISICGPQVRYERGNGFTFKMKTLAQGLEDLKNVFFVARENKDEAEKIYDDFENDNKPDDDMRP